MHPAFVVATSDSAILGHALDAQRSALLSDWLDQHLIHDMRRGLVPENELRSQCHRFVELFVSTLMRTTTLDARNEHWDPLRRLLADIAATRARQGFSPLETMSFVFSFKRPLSRYVSDALQDEPAALAAMSWAIDQLLDALGLHATETLERSRNAVITRQRQELLELSTPVLQLWKGVLALPLVGTLDSSRALVMTEMLLQRIAETRARTAIIDITGIQTVDTLVAQHLLKTIAAARLMGTDCLISGVRPHVAQTMVYLGAEFASVTTALTLADAFAIALRSASNDAT